MKYFALFLWCIVCAGIDAYFIPQSFQYLFGYIAGSVGLGILQFD
jgi:hypothetical protein